jgi:Putative addiction module component
MNIPVDVLEAEVLSLPAELRSRLLDKLIASLDHDAEWLEAWAAEADRREAAIAAGQSQWLPGVEVVAQIRAKLE